jgi:hypothetical protein
MNTTQKNADVIEISDVQNANCKQEWNKPEVNRISVIVETEGDPTISDDGLGDGLFS